jgi:hypothetical protein
MLEEKSWTMPSGEDSQSFQRTVSNLNLLNKDDQEKLKKYQDHYGNKVVGYLNQAKSELESNNAEIYKIKFPKAGTPSGDAQLVAANTLLNAGANLHEPYILGTLDDAIQLKQYDLISYIAKKFESMPVKDRKSLDLKTAVLEKADEAFKQTDLAKRQKYALNLKRQLNQIQQDLEVINFGQIKNISDWKNAYSNGQFK